LDQVFDPFVTTKAAGHGTGLGLAVCHTIVERLGGTIEAGNRAEGGAAFAVVLPTAS
jgi:C4-dicarboxylate-specific signal transduction histidine kinase